MAFEAFVRLARPTALTLSGNVTGPAAVVTSDLRTRLGSVPLAPAVVARHLHMMSPVKLTCKCLIFNFSVSCVRGCVDFFFHLYIRL